MYAALWREFGIPADRAGNLDATWIRRLNVLAVLRQAGGGEDAYG